MLNWDLCDKSTSLSIHNDYTHHLLIHLSHFATWAKIHVWRYYGSPWEAHAQFITTQSELHSRKSYNSTFHGNDNDATILSALNIKDFSERSVNRLVFVGPGNVPTNLVSNYMLQFTIFSHDLALPYPQLSLNPLRPLCFHHSSHYASI